MRGMPMRVRLLCLLVLSSGAFACGGTTPATMEFVEIVPAQPKLGDVVTVRFLLKDDRGVPLSGAPKQASTIKGSGIAETQLQVNSRVTSVIVVATAGDKQVSSPPITFAGSVPNGRQFNPGRIRSPHQTALGTVTAIILICHHNSK